MCFVFPCWKGISQIQGSWKGSLPQNSNILYKRKIHIVTHCHWTQRFCSTTTFLGAIYFSPILGHISRCQADIKNTKKRKKIRNRKHSAHIGPWPYGTICGPYYLKEMSYFISLNPLLFNTIAHVRSLKHMCICVFVYFWFDTRECHILNLYLCTSVFCVMLIARWYLTSSPDQRHMMYGV